MASTATTGSLAAGAREALLVVVLVVVTPRDHDLATGVGAANRAHPVRPARAVAARALAERGGRDPMLRTALGGAAVRLLLLGNGHVEQEGYQARCAFRSRDASLQAQLPQLGPARVGRSLVAVLGAGLVEVDGTHRAEAGTVGPAEHLHGSAQREGIVRPSLQV